MSKEKIRDLVICALALIVLVLAITTNVFATGDTPNLVADLGNNNNNSNNNFLQIENGTLNNANANQAPVNNALNNTNSNANTNNNVNANKTAIPYTGVDYSVIFIIAVCGISAVYAYKKIRDYKSL